MNDTTALPPPGSFFLRHIPGRGGRMISAMQGFVRGGSFWTHAGLILDNGEAIQAQPRGAVIFPAKTLLDGQPVFFSDRPVQDWLKARRPTSDEPVIRMNVVEQGRKFVGVKYSYLDYPTLGLAELARAHQGNQVLACVVEGLRNHIRRTGHMICSALVDAAYVNAGIHLFDDGRLPGDVTPQDLAEFADPNA